MAKKRAKKQARDWYQEITDQMIAMLEEGTKPWARPWVKQAYNGLPMRHNGEFYRGVNVFLLDLAATCHGFSSGYWMTFKQAMELGGSVRKGEKSTTIFKSGTYTKKIDMTNLETGEQEEVEQRLKFLKAYPVFNADQIEGLPEQYAEPPRKPAAINDDERREDLEAFFGAQLSTIHIGGDRAFYRPSTDSIHMPPFEHFNRASGYYATLAHEHVHWTKAQHRINRDLGSKGFGSQGYAKEELVAELGAAYLSRFFQFENHDRADHAAYLACWLKVLKNDKREIFRAAAHAQRAVDWMLDRAGLLAKPEDANLSVGLGQAA